MYYLHTFLTSGSQLPCYSRERLRFTCMASPPTCWWKCTVNSTFLFSYAGQKASENDILVIIVRLLWSMKNKTLCKYWHKIISNHLLATRLTIMMSSLVSTAFGLFFILTLSNSGILPHPKKHPPLIFWVRNLQDLSQKLPTLVNISLGLGSTHRNSI